MAHLKAASRNQRFSFLRVYLPAPRAACVAPSFDIALVVLVECSNRLENPRAFVPLRVAP
jgi:hypothetical protein